jgi:N-acetylglucosamine-6-phosphate deacetylase
MTRVVLRGELHGVDGGADAVLVEGGLIAWIGTGAAPGHVDEELVAEPGSVIAPGFVDLQVNGFGGHDAAGGRDAMASISDGLPSTGVTAFLPTLISAPIEEGASFAAQARSLEAPGARVLGAHIEGPFINPSYRGAHERSHLVYPSPARVETLLAARPRLVTIAPELPGGFEAVERLHRAGVVVSAGHTGADFEQGRRAIDAGVRFGTHVFNAMPAVHHRRPGIAMALLLDRRVAVGMIADGEHLHTAVCEQVVRLKDTMRVALTTDQTAAAGVPPGRYELMGSTVISDGVVARLEDGTLAGSAASMDDLVRLIARLPGMNRSRAITMATSVPARVLGEKKLGRIKVGACADLVILDPDLRVTLTMVGGEVKFRRERAAQAC